jgi:hypothetical protein
MICHALGQCKLLKIWISWRNFFDRNSWVKLAGVQKWGRLSVRYCILDRRTFTAYILTWRSVENLFSFRNLTVKLVSNFKGQLKIIIFCIFLIYSACFRDRHVGIPVNKFYYFMGPILPTMLPSACMQKFTVFAQFFLFSYFGEIQKIFHTLYKVYRYISTTSFLASAITSKLEAFLSFFHISTYIVWMVVQAEIVIFQ